MKVRNSHPREPKGENGARVVVLGTYSYATGEWYYFGPAREGSGIYPHAHYSYQSVAVVPCGSGVPAMSIEFAK